MIIPPILEIVDLIYPRVETYTILSRNKEICSKQRTIGDNIVLITEVVGDPVMC